jgi:hypothetical protein
MSWLGIGLGDAGSQVGQGYGLGQDWRQRQQQAAFENARQKLEAILGPLRLQQLQNQIKQAGLPQYQGMVPTSGGGMGAVMIDPDKGSPSVQELPGTKSNKKNYSAFRVGNDGKLYGFNSDTNQEEAIQSPEGAAFPVPGAANKDKLIKGDYTPDKNSATGYSRQMMDQQGNVVKTVPNVLIPGMTPKETEGFAITQDEDGNVIMVPKTTITKPAGPGAVPSAGGTQGSTIIGHKDTGIQRDAVKSSQQARDAYTNYQDAVRNSQSNNPRTNVALIASAVRSMVAGAGRMTTAEIQAEANAGSFGDKVQRWMTMAASGTLPDDQRQQILEQIKNDYDTKRASGEQAWNYSYPGKPLPPWLRAEQQQNSGGGNNAPPPPPAGYVLDKTQ